MAERGRGYMVLAPKVGAKFPNTSTRMVIPDVQAPFPHLMIELLHNFLY
jgi:hypothetical protein